MTKACFGNIIIFVTSFNKFVINEKEKVMIGDYMTNRILKTAGLFCFCTLMAAAAPEQAMADQESPESQLHAEAVQEGPKSQTAAETVQEGPKSRLHAIEGPEEPAIIIAGRKDSGEQIGASMLIQVEDENTEVYLEPDAGSQVVGQAEAGDTYDVLEMVDGQWAKISTGEFEGYLNTAAAEDEDEALEETGEEAQADPAEAAEENAVQTSAERRQAVVEYGLQFVGNRYVYGGTNPNKGADCSGFTSYVLRHAAGVELPHSSRSQAVQGREVSAAEIRPGDLVFYASGKRINHVALYIGNGQVVHASNERTGICVSEWTYRNPVKIVNVLGD